MEKWDGKGDVAVYHFCSVVSRLLVSYFPVIGPRFFCIASGECHSCLHKVFSLSEILFVQSPLSSQGLSSSEIIADQTKPLTREGVANEKRIFRRLFFHQALFFMVVVFFCFICVSFKNVQVLRINPVCFMF